MSKTLKPVDRALADVSRQIQTIESQLRHMGHAVPTPVASPRKVELSFLQRICVPPKRRSPVGATQGVFDTSDNPLAELTDEPVTVTMPGAQPEFFTTTNTGAKLSPYMVNSPKPILRGIQRKNRNRFYVWLGLAFAAVWLIYAVVR